MKYLFLFFLGCIFTANPSMKTFEESQLNFARVKTAKYEKERLTNNYFRAKNIDPDEAEIFFRVFKAEQIFEVWAKNKEDKRFVLLKSYDICYSSGKLGPKRKEGDLQVPEGLYEIAHFNPESNFYLSLGINYPNESDKILSDKSKPGGDIYIHGNCVSIGCIPLTDDFIKEIYWMAVKAKSNGQEKIACHIFPFRLKLLGQINENSVVSVYGTSNLTFWKTLFPFYDYFEKNAEVPEFKVNISTGKYELVN